MTQPCGPEHPTPAAPRPRTYGVCSACRRGRALCADRTLGAHQRLSAAGYSLGRCSGSWEPALAILPGPPANRLDVYLEPGADMPATQEPEETPRLQPDPQAVAAQVAVMQADMAKSLEALVPVIAQFVENLAPVFAQIGAAVERIAKDLDTMVQQAAAANRRERIR